MKHKTVRSESCLLAISNFTWIEMCRKDPHHSASNFQAGVALHFQMKYVKRGVPINQWFPNEKICVIIYASELMQIKVNKVNMNWFKIISAIFSLDSSTWLPHGYLPFPSLHISFSAVGICLSIVQPSADRHLSPV